MALLLAMYQKMRLIREKNQATYDLTKYSSKLSRVQKNIERVQKRYTSLFAQIESQAKMMQSSAQNLFLNMAGLGASQVNPYDYSNMTGFVQRNIYEALRKGQEGDSEKNIPEIKGMNDSQIADLIQRYMRDGGIKPKVAEGGKEYEKDSDGNYVYEGFTADEVNFFEQARQWAVQSQQNAQWQVQKMNTAYGTNITIWADAQKAQLEEEQDAALEPLHYEETMCELEKQNLELKLERVKAELEYYTRICSEEAKEQAPKFGLG